MSKIIVIGSQKGGVGKTTTTFNLAYALSKMGKKVLAVDFDSQANLTTCFGVENTDELNYTIGHLMMTLIEDSKGIPIKKCISKSNGVDFIPASIYLSAVDAKLHTEMGAEKILAELLESLRNNYDYILIDTCPSLGILTINALTVADEVIITANPQLLSMMGLQEFLNTITKIKRRINPKIKIAGILLTMYEKRTNLCKVLTDEMQDFLRGKIHIFDAKIPNTVKVGESIYYGKSVLEYSPKSSASLEYRKLAREVIANES